MGDKYDLIAEAFKKHEALSWDDGDVARDAAIRWHMRGFNDALEVSEKARELTGDEQEELALLVKNTFARHMAKKWQIEFENDPPTLVHRAIADRILAAGFRRC